MANDSESTGSVLSEWADDMSRAIFIRLQEPFPQEEVRHRTQGGRDLSYITSRTVMNRLDEVLGPKNWWDDFIPQEKSVICRLTIRLPGGETITKCDAGGYAGMSDSGDDEKSGFSDAFKRAAVKFGIGRELYQDGITPFVAAALNLNQRDLQSSRPSGGGYPAPSQQRPSPPAPRQQPSGGGQGGKSIEGVRTGRDLWGFVKDDKALIAAVNEFGKQMSFPARMVEWGEDEVAEYVSHWRGSAA